MGSSIQIQFLGSGDAFGSGGRLQTCIMIKTGQRQFLVDCGTTSLAALRRSGIDLNTIDSILLSHLHGDHFAGIPFFILDEQLVSKRKRSSTIAGLHGI